MTHPEAGMSSLRRALLVLAVVVTLVAGLGATIEPAAAAAYRTTANLNLRTGPGTSYAVIRTIPSGATVEVTGDAQSGFLPVTYSGSSGFASADFLTSGSSSGSGTTSGPTGTRYVVDGRLNLRSGPSTSYGVILVLQDGSSVQLTGEVSGSYSKVTSNGSTGWVATQYLSTSGGSNRWSVHRSGGGVCDRRYRHRHRANHCSPQPAAWSRNGVRHDPDHAVGRHGRCDGHQPVGLPAHSLQRHQGLVLRPVPHHRRR